jgi:5-formyltetrahydrofolate cyclo-ligase
MSEVPAEEKAALRKTAIDMRARLAEAAGPKAALLIARRVLGDFVFMKGAVVAGYAAIGSEVDPFPLMAALSTQGHPLCLPRVEAKALVFRAWKPGDPMVIGPMNISEPDAKAKERRPDLLLVPLLAFDRDGYRLGYGAGYYDRYLSAHRAKRTIRAVGIAYAGQAVERLPRAAHDEPLDAVATEEGVIRFERT